tara:strand:- start:100 stop:369 length:270 start_codon:yes stop_codon:yes gene_type:complete
MYYSPLLLIVGSGKAINPFWKNSKRLLVVRSPQVAKRFLTGQGLITPTVTPVPAYGLYRITEPTDHQIPTFKKLAGKSCLGNRSVGVVM